MSFVLLSGVTKVKAIFDWNILHRRYFLVSNISVNINQILTVYNRHRFRFARTVVCIFNRYTHTHKSNGTHKVGGSDHQRPLSSRAR